MTLGASGYCAHLSRPLGIVELSSFDCFEPVYSTKETLISFHEVCHGPNPIRSRSRPPNPLHGKDDPRLPTEMTMQFNVIPEVTKAPSELLWLDKLKRGAVPRDLWMHTANLGLNDLADISLEDEQGVISALGTELESVLKATEVPKEWSVHGQGKCGNWGWESKVGPDHTCKLGSGGFEWRLRLSQSSRRRRFVSHHYLSPFHPTVPSQCFCLMSGRLLVDVYDYRSSPLLMFPGGVLVLRPRSDQSCM